MPTPAACCPVLVERDRELAVLARVAREVSTGISQLVILSGEAGAGKSRLAAEFMGSLPADWRTRVTGSVRWDRSALGVTTPTASSECPESDLGDALAASLRSLLPSPVAVLFEDIHELDPTLIRALGIAVELLDEAPVLFVATFRVGPDVLDDGTGTAIADLRRRARVIDLTVGPLTGHGVAAMAGALGRALDAESVADVLRRSGGNAFFAEELLLASDASLSWTVTHAVLERVRAAGAVGRRVAELLAIAGASLPKSVVETVEPGSDAGIATLLAAGIAVESGHDHLALRHALVGEVVAGHLSLAERTAWHSALAQCLEDCEDAPAADIARHWLAAGDTRASARWAMRAADQAADARLFVTASALYTVALTTPPLEPLAHASLLERAAMAAGWAGASSTAFIRATLADARFREAGEPQRARSMWLNPTLRHLPKPTLEAPPPGDADVASLIVASERACLDRNYAEGAALARHALQLARAPGAEPSWETEAAYRLVRCGALAEGEAALQRTLAAAAVAGDWALVARCASVMVEVPLTWGDIELSISYQHQAIAAMARLGRRGWAADVGLALLHACRGDLADAQRRVGDVLARDEPIGVEFAQLPAAWIDLELGELERVAERIARMRPVRSLGIATFTMGVLLIQARLRHRQGDADGALAALDEADAVNADLFEPGRPDRLILRARVAFELGDVAMISAVRRELIELIERGGGGLIRAGADWAGGLWAQQAGDGREARRRLQAAAEGCEQASRFVMAVEAWCDLAALAATRDDPDVCSMAIERAEPLATGRGLVALLARLHEIADGIAGEASWPRAFDALTQRQREIAVLVAAGSTNRQVGERLFLSEHTVRNQLVHIFAALGVTRRSELSALAHGRNAGGAPFSAASDIRP